MIEQVALQKLSYGLFVLTAQQGGLDNGCIINTAIQVTASPSMLLIAVNKQNYTHDMIYKTGKFNLSVLSTDVPFSVFQHFGFQTGRTTNKFANFSDCKRSENGLLYLDKYANSFFSASLVAVQDTPTHTIFTAKITEAKVLSTVPSVTYAYYFENIKPKVQTAPAAPKKSSGKVWVCEICGFTYDEEKEGVPFAELPDTWVCPLCKHPKSDFVLKA